MINFTANKYVKLSRACFQIAHLFDCAERSDSIIIQNSLKEIIGDSKPTDFIANQFPELLQIGMFYMQAAGQAACVLNTSHIDKMIKNEEHRELAQEILRITQFLSKHLHLWLSIEKNKRVRSLERLTRKLSARLSMDPHEFALSLDTLARKLEDTWTDKSDLYSH